MEAKQGIITASGEHDQSSGPDNLNRPNNFWVSARKKITDQWLVMEFSQAVTVNGFRVRGNAPSLINHYRCEQSAYSSTWITIKSGQMPQSTSDEWKEAMFDQLVTSKKFRLFILNNSGNENFIQVKELKLSFVAPPPGEKYFSLANSIEAAITPVEGGPRFGGEMKSSVVPLMAIIAICKLISHGPE